jgi:hypothetical protein
LWKKEIEVLNRLSKNLSTHGLPDERDIAGSLSEETLESWVAEIREEKIKAEPSGKKRTAASARTTRPSKRPKDKMKKETDSEESSLTELDDSDA